MRPLWKDMLTAVWLGILLPGILLNVSVRNIRQQGSQIPEKAQAETTGLAVMLREPGGSRRGMDLNTYLTGVLLAEMPTDFQQEALKAQAVAARTYTWKAVTTGGKHGDGSVCTEYACCQAYISEEAYLDRGGTWEGFEKVRRAVDATGSMVLVFEGELIEATYFSSTDGFTEAAVEVWGADVPYLRPVTSPEAVSPRTVSLPASEFRQLLQEDLPEDPAQWFGSVRYTQGGGVAELEIGGNVYTGVELRALLGLRSTAFQIRADGENVYITTRGYGHRVGMSQYGANAMAEGGSTWQQILQHYYPGTALAPIEERRAS